MNEQRKSKSGQRKEGPQGTTLFSRDDVERVLKEAGASVDSGSSSHLRVIGGDQRFALSGGRAVIGRAEHCQIILDDPSVSSEHARLSPSADGWQVANLLSSNGTFINDVKISTAVLKHGDRLRLGRVELILHDPGRAADSRSGRPWWLWASMAAAVVVGGLVWWLAR